MHEHDTHPVSDALGTRIRSVIGKQFGPAIVERVEILADTDHDDDPILRIVVVLRDDAGKLDMTKVLQTTRLLRHELAEIDEWRFPNVTFTTAQEERDVAA